MFIVDSNVLIFGVNDDSPRQAEALGAIERWVEERTPFAVTWGIAYEFLRVVTHPAVFPRPLTFAQAWAFLDSLRLRARLTFLVETPEHPTLVAAAATEIPALAGSRMHDLHTALIAREHGVADVLSDDTDFSRFPWINAIRPFPNGRSG